MNLKEEQKKQNAGFLGALPDDITCYVANELDRTTIYHLISTCSFFATHEKLRTIKDNKPLPLIAAGQDHCLFLTSSGTLFVFGV